MPHQNTSNTINALNRKNLRVKDIIFFILMVVVCRLLLDYVYTTSISPFFDYARLINSPTKDSVMKSWSLLALFTIITIPFLSPRKDLYTSSLVLFLFVVRVISLTSYVQYAPQPSLYLVYNIVYWCWLLFLLNSSFLSKDFFPHSKGNATIVNICAIIAMLSVVIVSGFYTGFRLHFTLDDVYDLREEARGYSVPTILAYLLQAAGNVIPILIVYYILKKDRWFVIALLAVGVLNFGIAGQKATIFKILACVSMIYIKNLYFRKLIMPFFIVLLFLSALLFALYEDISIPWVVIRRIFYVPNVIDTFYFDYFQNHDPLFFDSTATGELAFDISTEYGGREGARANNGLFTDAIQNLGFVGLIIMPIIITALVRLFSNVLKRQHPSVIFFTAIVMASTLHSSLLTRCLFTHGFILLYLVLFFLPSYNTVVRERRKDKENDVIGLEA